MFTKEERIVDGATVRIRYDGSIEVSDIVRDHRVSRVYHGYTVEQAVEDFKQVAN